MVEVAGERRLEVSGGRRKRAAMEAMGVKVEKCVSDKGEEGRSGRGSDGWFAW